MPMILAMPMMNETTAGRRLALVIATGTYADPALAKLRAPGRDASDLAAVLDDDGIGGFEVEVLLDAPAESLRRQIAQFCTGVSPGDLVLVYLSCHGVLDDRGRLYYATTDTDRSLLAATAVPSAWLNEQLEDCRGRQQILILDCCHSGAFAKGAKGESDLALGERFEGRGRVVLTGSRGTEYSFEHDQVVGTSTSSVFTGALVEGLRSGDADRDRDGIVSVGELYDYAYDTVRSKEARQTPTLWTYGAEGDLAVAQSPRGAIVEPLPLPEDLVMLLESHRPRVREGAVKELAELLTGSNPGRALTARQELERVADEDVTSVSSAAKAALERSAVTVAPKRPPPRKPPPPPPSKPPGSSQPSGPGPPPARPPAAPAWLRGAGLRRTIAIAGMTLVAVIVIVIAAAGGGSESTAPDRIPVEGSPRGIAVGEEAAWVTRHDAGLVGKIELATDTESEPIDVGPNPGKITEGEGSVWVSVAEGKKLTRIDAGTGEPTGTKPFEGGPCKCISEMAIANGALWVSSEGREAVLEELGLETGERNDKVAVGPGFQGDFAVNGDIIWAIGNDAGVSWVRWIDPTGEESGERVTEEGNPFSFSGITHGRELVWIADAEHGLVIPFDPATEKPGLKIPASQAIPVAKGVSGDDIAAIKGGLLVWNGENGWMSRIDSKTKKVVEQARIRGYKADIERHSDWSDLGMDDEGHAWVTDPAGEAVFKVTYEPKFSGF
ncbi:MAG: hypothetical protein QOE56_2426 [Solirubrobacterales bacterium]|jgi:hypothetical protein|nr:hypothetical protein [Solirubrobacterales bacterium]